MSKDQSSRVPFFKVPQVSKTHQSRLGFVDRYRSHIQEFQKLVRHISRISGACLVEDFSIFYVSYFEISKTTFLEMVLDSSRVSWSHLVYPKCEIIGLGSHGHVR